MTSVDLAWHLFGANWLGHRYCMYLLSHIVVVLDANVITELTMAVSGGQHILHILASHCQNNYTDCWHSCSFQTKQGYNCSLFKS